MEVGSCYYSNPLVIFQLAQSTNQGNYSGQLSTVAFGPTFCPFLCHRTPATVALLTLLLPVDLCLKAFSLNTV